LEGGLAGRWSFDWAGTILATEMGCERREAKLLIGDGWRWGGEAMSAEKTYSEGEILERLKALGLAHWYFEDGWIRRKFSTDGWPTTLMLVNAIGFLCEAAYHHADLSVTYAKLWVKLMTHSAGGITEKDFALAVEIERLATWRPAAGGALEGTPNKFVSVGGKP
jgi:4a-hydroxytetrahydrobiopterin dehydratase